MLKIDRSQRTFKKLDSPSLADARILERADLQECIYNSSEAFFSEIGEKVFILGKEVAPSDTVSDRIDLLAVDAEGRVLIVELKRGSNKLQMLQAISYAGMIARWYESSFQSLLSEDAWQELIEFLDVEPDEMNIVQRVLLVAEGFDFALLSAAEWLVEQYGVDIRCTAVSLATDSATGTEYLACGSVFPLPELAEQATARGGSGRRVIKPLKWDDWEEALKTVENDDVREFAMQCLHDGLDHYLRRRGFFYRLDGKRRWNLYCRKRNAYVWQTGRFDDDLAFWQEGLSDASSVKPVKRDSALSFNLHTSADFVFFRNAATKQLTRKTWSDG